MLLIELLTESTMSRVCYWLYREYFRAFANGTPDWFIPDVSEIIYKSSADTPAHLS